MFFAWLKLGVAAARSGTLYQCEREREKKNGKKGRDVANFVTAVDASIAVGVSAAWRCVPRK